MITLVQQAEIYALTWACTLAKGKTANIYTENIYAFGVAHDFGMLQKQCGFLISSRNKILNGPYVQELLDTIRLPLTLAIAKILGHSKFDSLEVTGIHLATISARNDAFKGTNRHHVSVMVQRDISPNDNLEKLVREPNNWP